MKVTEPRIALVAPGEIFGGAERQILTFLKALRARGHAPQLGVFHDAELAHRARTIGVTTTVLGVRSLYDVAALARLRRMLEEAQAQIVHVHGYRAAVYCALLPRIKGLAAVKTEHGGVETASGGLWSRMRPALYRMLENRSARHLRAHVVYVTKELRDRCIGEHRAARSHVIYNGIESLESLQTARPPEYDPARMNVAIVGRLEPVKGIEHALRAIALSATPRQVHLHIVGTGPLQSQLEQLVAQLNVGERIHFAGFKTNVYDYIAHADALLMPSLHEGLPYTILEAMALRTPILASRVGGLAEVLVDGSSALLFEPASASSIAATLSRLCSEPSLGQKLIAQAGEDVSRHYSAERMTDNYLALFRSIS